MFRIDGIVRDYAWGDPEAIPRLLGTEPDGGPKAELWLGAHPSAPATTDDGRALDAVIGADPDSALGADIAHRYGRLPFLTKVLAAARPLSIQTHPDLDRAREGFAREDAAGIPIDARERTYRDDNHKPELICALEPFEALFGFRARSATVALFDQIGGEALAPLRERLGAEGDDRTVLTDVLAWLLALGADDVGPMIDAALAGLAATSGHEAEARWCPRLADAYPGDPGVLVALLLNHVTLAPGEALYLGAGNLHAYLRGVGVEVMANSDNVIRGGLTPKHVDIPELVEVVDATPLAVEVLRPSGPVHTYASGAPEFALTRVELGPDPTTLGTGPSVVLVTDGRAMLRAGDGSLELGTGRAAFVPADEPPLTVAGEGLLFRVGVQSA